jgi:uncharacterized membrane protein YphA (DoxX/SURF4 family)
MSKVASKLPTVARILLGLVFFVFGLNGFLHFLPNPPLTPAAGSLLGAFVASGYLLALVKGTEVVVGALLLAGRFVPLALTVLAPVLVNIVAFHLFLAPSGLGLPIVLVAIEIYLAWAYRRSFAPLVQARAETTPAPRRARVGASAAAA